MQPANPAAAVDTGPTVPTLPDSYENAIWQTEEIGVARFTATSKAAELALDRRSTSVL
jgi:hypothetical protein